MENWEKDKIRIENIKERDEWLEGKGYGKISMKRDIELFKEWYKKKEGEVIPSSRVKGKEK